MTTTAPDVGAALAELSAAQEIAAEALATGATHTQAAKAADVARETVSRWAGHHREFRAAVSLYRSTLAAEQADTIRRIRGRALALVEAQLDGADLSGALAVLRTIAAPRVEVTDAEGGPIEIRRGTDRQRQLLAAVDAALDAVDAPGKEQILAALAPARTATSDHERQDDVPRRSCGPAS